MAKKIKLLYGMLSGEFLYNVEQMIDSTGCVESQKKKISKTVNTF